MHFLCQILNVKQWQHIPNELIQKKSKLPCMYNIIAQQDQRRVGHLNRLEDSRLPKYILYILFSQLSEGSHKISGPKLKRKDIIKGKMRSYDHPFRQLVISVQKAKRKLKEKKISGTSSSDTMVNL